MRLGVFGGTFDPVHLGHLIAAEEVRAKSGLEKVLFVPAGNPWLKAHRAVTPPSDRLEMLRLALQSNPCFEVCTVDLERPGPSYTVDTIVDLKRQFPGAEIFFIAGLDALADLPRWHEPDRLLRMCQVIGMRRPVPCRLNFEELERQIPGASQRIVVVDVPQIEISSSEIRRRIAEGMTIRYQAPEAVEDYIGSRGLYAGIFSGS